MEEVHLKYLYNFLHRDFIIRLKSLRKAYDSYGFKDDSSMKIFLLETLESFKKQYEKILKLVEAPDIYDQIYNLINCVLPVFPHDWDELHFKKLMEKTFKEDNLNKINGGSFYDYCNKNYKNYKNYKDYKDYKYYE